MPAKLEKDMGLWLRYQTPLTVAMESVALTGHAAPPQRDMGGSQDRRSGPASELVCDVALVRDLSRYQPTYRWVGSSPTIVEHLSSVRRSWLCVSTPL